MSAKPELKLQIPSRSNTPSKSDGGSSVELIETKELPPDVVRPIQEHEYNHMNLLITDHVLFQGVGSNVFAFNRWTRELIKVYTRHSCFVSCIESFRNTLFTGSHDKTVIAWNTKKGVPIFTFKHKSAVTSLQLYTVQGITYLFSSSWDGCVRMLNFMKGTIDRVFKIKPAGARQEEVWPIETFILHRDHLIMGSRNVMKIFSIHDDVNPVKEFIDTKERLYHSMALHYEERQDPIHEDNRRNYKHLIVSGSHVTVYDISGTVKDWQEAKVIWPQEAHPESKINLKDIDSVTHMQVRANGFYSGHLDGSIREFDLLTMTQVSERKQEGPVTSMILRRNILCTGTVDGIINVSTQLKDSLTGHLEEIICMKARKGVLYTASKNGDVRSWDLYSGNINFIGLYKGSAASVTGMCLNDGFLYECNNMGNIVCWNTNKAKVEFEIRTCQEYDIDPCFSIAFDDSRKRLYVGKSNRIQVYELQTLRRLDSRRSSIVSRLPCPECFEIEVQGVVTSMKIFKGQLYANTHNKILRMNMESFQLTKFIEVDNTGIESVEELQMFFDLDQDNNMIHGGINNQNKIYTWSMGGNLVDVRDVPTELLTPPKDERVPVSPTSATSRSMHIALNHHIPCRGVAVVSYGHGPMLAVAFGEDPRYSITSQSTDAIHSIVCYSLPHFQHIRTLKKFHSSPIQTMISYDRYLFVGASDQLLSIWNVSTGARIKAIDKHHDPIRSLVYDTDNGLLYSSSNRIFVFEFQLFTSWGLDVTYKVGCGSCGLYGQPWGDDACAQEQKRQNGVKSNGKDLLQIVESGRRALESVDEEKKTANLPEMAFDIHEWDGAWAKRLRRIWAHVDNLILSMLLLLVEVIQIASFAFTLGLSTNTIDPKRLSNGTDTWKLSIWRDTRDVIVWMQGMQTFTDSDREYDAKFIATCVGVIVCWFIFVSHDAIEWIRFLNPTNHTIGRLWDVIRVIIKLLAECFFIPMLQSMILIFICDGISWDVNVNIECYVEAHLARAAISAVALSCYLVAVARLTRVGYELKRIHVRWSPLSWRKDIVPTVYRNPFSLSSTIPDFVTLFVKIGLVLTAVLTTRYTDVQAAVQFALVLLLPIAQHRYPAYFSTNMSAIRSGFYYTICWIHFTALISSTTDKDNEISYWMLIGAPPMFLIGFFMMKYLRHKFEDPTNHRNVSRKTASRRLTIVSPTAHKRVYSVVSTVSTMSDHGPIGSFSRVEPPMDISRRNLSGEFGLLSTNSSSQPNINVHHDNQDTHGYNHDSIDDSEHKHNENAQNSV